MLLGPELIKDSCFDDAGYWTVDDGWSVSAGKAIWQPPSYTGEIYPAEEIAISPARIYRVAFDIVAAEDPSKAGLQIILGGTEDPAGYPDDAYTDVGSYSLDITAGTTDKLVKIHAESAGQYYIHIDNFSVKEIIQGFLG